MRKKKQKLLLSVSIDVESNVQERWLEWAEDYYVPEMLATGCFEHCRISYLEEDEDSGFHTYRLDFISPDPEDLERFETEFAHSMEKELKKKFLGKYNSMSTLYQLIDEMKK